MARGMYVEDRVKPVKEPYTFYGSYRAFLWRCFLAEVFGENLG
jgi:hypothetical protein